MLSFNSESIKKELNGKTEIGYGQHFYDMSNNLHVNITNGRIVVEDLKLGLSFVLRSDDNGETNSCASTNKRGLVN